MHTNEFVLNRDCPATLIPAGTGVVLAKDTKCSVNQALGGTVTIMTNQGLFRIDAGNLDALGTHAVEIYGIKKTGNATGEFSLDAVWDALRECFDPEIPLNIVDLGLIYDLAVEDEPDGRKKVLVKITLTAPGCGMGPVIANDAKTKIESLPNVAGAEVVIVWDPAWNPAMILPDGRKQLGLE